MKELSTRVSRILALFLVLAFFVPAALAVPAAGKDEPKIQEAKVNPVFLAYQSGTKSEQNIKVNGKSKGLGYIPSPVDKSHLKGWKIKVKEGVVTAEEAAPGGGSGIVSFSATYDLRTLGRVSPVKDQGGCGSCWAFASYGSAESTALPTALYDFSENNLKNTAGFDLGACSGGNADMSTAYMVRWSGPVAESADPYNAASSISPAGLASIRHTQEVYYLPARTSATDNDNIKTALQAYGGVYSTVYMTSSAFNGATNALYYAGTTGSNHAITLVGWDDNYPASNFLTPPPGNGAFIAKNSWGSYWGNAGYFYISYYDVRVGKDNAVFTSEPTTNYDRVYQYDPLGWTSSFGNGKDTAYFANIFTVEASESLTAVAFYTPQVNSNYQVSVYLDPTSGPINPAGAASTISGTLALPGYHTLPLTTPVTLTPGHKFSVAVWLNTPGYTFPIPAESRISGYTSKAVSSPGESYFSDTGTTWYDLTSYYTNRSIALKAFTKASTQTPNPIPTLSGLSPSSATAGGPAFTLTVTGTNFVQGSVVRWNGADRTTNRVSSTQLTASIPASDIVSAVPATVTVFNPAPGGGTSNALTFTINNPVPSVAVLTPSATAAGSPAFTMTVDGSNFVAGSKVYWKGTERTTRYVSASRLSADVLTADVSTAGTAGILVTNPAPGGGTSGTATFTITAANNPVPAITGISPASATAGGAGFTLTVDGTNFVAGSKIRWNGIDRPSTTFVSSTRLTTSVVPADIATPGTATVTVFNPAPGGGTSNGATFTIVAPSNPIPAISTISPSSTAAGSPEFSLTVTGTNFVPGSVVRWKGLDRPTVYFTPASLTASIPASDVAVVGTASVTVFNPTPGGGTSNGATFTISQAPNLVPTITALSPSSANAGGAGFTLTVTGTNFVSGSVIRWNNNDRTTTYVSPTSLTTWIPNTDIASAGTAYVTVFNPAPGGGTSASKAFTINPSSSVKAAFSGTPTTGRAPLAVKFTDASTGTPDSWSWDFGDGYTSTSQHPSHSYAKTGYYTVTLTITKGASSDKLVKTSYIQVRKGASIKIHGSSG